MRDRDANTGWTSAADSALEERRFYAQNWRADVVAITKSDGQPTEFIRYTSYGTAQAFAAADVNRDGTVNSTDASDWADLYSETPSGAAIPVDFDFDGSSFNPDDDTAFNAAYTEASGWSNGSSARSGGRLSRIGNRKGYAGYEFDHSVAAYHVRHRAYVPEIGRWITRDPIGYLGGFNLFEYVGGTPISDSDPSGLVPGGVDCPAQVCPAYSQANDGSWLTGTKWSVPYQQTLTFNLPPNANGLTYRIDMRALVVQRATNSDIEWRTSSSTNPSITMGRNPTGRRPPTRIGFFMRNPNFGFAFRCTARWSGDGSAQRTLIIADKIPSTFPGGNISPTSINGLETFLGFYDVSSNIATQWGDAFHDPTDSNTIGVHALYRFASIAVNRRIVTSISAGWAGFGVEFGNWVAPTYSSDSGENASPVQLYQCVTCERYDSVTGVPYLDPESPPVCRDPNRSGCMRLRPCQR